MPGLKSTAWSTVFEHTSDAVLVLDAERCIVEVNRAAEQLLGERATLVGRSVKAVLPDWRTVESRTAENLASEVELVWEAPGGAPGSARHLRVRTLPLKDEAGHAAGLVLLLQVVTESKEAQASLRKQKEFFESVVRNSPVAIVTISRDFHVMSWNPAAERLFGFTPQEALGHNILELVASADSVRAEGEQASREALQRGRVHSVTRRVRKDGSVVDVELLALPVSVDDEKAGFIAIYHDITDLQRARQAAEGANHAKSLFLATISHEIRTPMNAILGMTGLLLGTELTPEQRDFASTIQQSGNALLVLLDDILDLSKIEAGRLELEHRPFDLRECVESVLDLLAARASEKGLDLGCFVAEHTPPALLGDGARLRQVLLNLVGNAVKFTAQGGVAVSVEVLHRAGEASGLWELHFAVQDTGAGIPADKRERLFQPFSQLDASVSRRFGGTGLGLAICKRLVEAMGGRIWVESAGEPGRGSTFHFTVCAPAAPLAEVTSPSFEQPLLRGRRALIVDDNALGRRLLGLQLRAWGLQPFEVSSGVEALQSLEAGARFDLAFVDHQMPMLDGVALADRIRRQQEARGLPLLLLTSPGQRERQPPGTFAAVLTRPVKASQLYDALVTCLSQHVDLGPLRRGRSAREASLFKEKLGEQLPLRILLAEDNPTNQKLALLVLERLGYRADVATNGHEALRALTRQRYDVVLMDMQMPEMDGLEATRRIRREVVAQHQPCIIAMTANALDSDRRQCLEAGMDDYLSKPLRVEALVAALRRTQQREASNGAPNGAPARELTPVGGSRTVAAEAAPPDGLRVPGLEPAALLRLHRDFGEQVRRIVPELIHTALESMPSLLQEARAALLQGQSDNLSRAAHTLKSNAAYFGASTMEQLCRELEQRAGANALDGLPELLARCEAEFERTRGLLERLRLSLAS